MTDPREECLIPIPPDFRQRAVKGGGKRGQNYLFLRVPFQRLEGSFCPASLADCTQVPAGSPTRNPFCG